MDLLLHLTLFVVTTTLLLFKRKSAPQLVGYFIAITLIIVVVGLRGKSVGTDTHNYYRMFWDIIFVQGSAYLDKLEPLYKLLNKSVFWCGGSPETLIFVSTLITYGFMASTIYRYSPSLPLSLATLYGVGPFFFLYSGIRQGIAIVLVFYSIKFVAQQKIIKFITTIIIAVGFHYSAIVFLPVYFLPKIHLKPIVLGIMWLISLIFIFDRNIAFLMLQEMLFFIPKTYIWAMSNPDLVGTEGNTGLGIRLIFTQLICLFLCCSYNKIETNEHKLILLFCTLGIIFSNIFFHAGFVNRIAFYFDVFLILSLPIAVHYMFKRANRAIVTFSLYCCCALFFARSLTTGLYDVLPYHTIFK